MCAILNKKSPLSRRMEKVRKELSIVKGDIGVLKKSIDSGEVLAGMPRLKSDGKRRKQSIKKRPKDMVDGHSPTGNEKREIKESKQEARVQKQESSGLQADERDDRLASYLTGSFQTAGLMRKERSKQRNKAVFMVIFFLIVLFLVLRNYF